MNLARNPSRPSLGRRILLQSLITAFCSAAAALAAPAPVTACTGQLELPTYPWSADRHPRFRGTDKVNIYPYAMLDSLSRQQTRRVYRTVVLENEYLRVTFLPELGGKIYDVLDKTTGQPMFYLNHVVKPGLIAQCGAWTSGGVEWNTGPQGHTVSCMVPVRVQTLPPQKDGSQGVAVGETERIYGTKWTVIVLLRPGRSYLEERVRIYNPTDTVRPYYFWNCTAVPNTPGFRFIYPMTLGCDHAGETFFTWPVDHGKDLTRGANYLDASSIFAWHCDQDFFGSYCDDLGRGLVSCANHHEVPGKKAWTWGQGGYGKLQQAALTDNDGPYNEVQTGPLLTQAQVGRLDPCQAVEWKEWWYPVHGIGGFTFANNNLAVNASLESGQVRVRLLGTANWPRATVELSKNGRRLAAARCQVSPRQPAEVQLATGGQSEPFDVEIAAAGRPLAAFRLPLDLPVRQPPQKDLKPPQTASELVRAGWQDFLFARFSEAEGRFKKALEQDAGNPEACTGLALLNLDRDPAAAAAAARQALAVDPDHGMARYALAAAEYRLGHESAALEEAWKAARDPAAAVAARALVAKLDLRRRDFSSAIAALSGDGPWREDPTCRNRLALALLDAAETRAASSPKKSNQSGLRRADDLARENLELDPLDPLALDIRLRVRAQPAPVEAALPMPRRADPHDILNLLAECSELPGLWRASPTLMSSVLAPATRAEEPEAGPLEYYWLAYLTQRQQPATTPNAPLAPAVRRYLSQARDSVRDSTGAYKPEAAYPQPLREPSPPALDTAFPYQPEAVPMLRWAIATDPGDGAAALYLGHLLFHLGRHAEARDLWKRAAELGAQPVVAWRALGMAARTLDGDLSAARQWLDKAAQADPKDAIVARDLGTVLFDLADKAPSDSERHDLFVQARDRLRTSFDTGKGRSDFVALLGRAQNRLGDFAETARMLDGVRVTVWEGAHELHDLFEQAHLALGEADLKAGRPADALVQFDRALDYPDNLATGKVENAPQAHIQYQRGNALAALGRSDQAIAAWKLAAAEPPSKDTRIEDARQKAKQALERSIR
jgi:tetratricopeptide (TPR) repeat protein